MIPLHQLRDQVATLRQRCTEMDGHLRTAAATITALRRSLESVSMDRTGSPQSLSTAFSRLSELLDRHPKAVSPFHGTQREDLNDYFQGFPLCLPSSVLQWLERVNGVVIGGFTLMEIPARSGGLRIHHRNRVYPRLLQSRFLTIAKEHSWIHFALDLKRPEPPVLCFNPLDQFRVPPEIVASSFTKFLVMLMEEVAFRLTHERMVRWPITKAFMDTRDPGLDLLGYRTPWRTA
jgi:hypothetical protein